MNVNIEQLENAINDLSYVTTMKIDNEIKYMIEAGVETFIEVKDELTRFETEEYENLIHENKVMAEKLNELGLSDEEISNLM